MSGRNGAAKWSEETRRAAGAEITVLKVGQGKPVLVLHEELGHPGPLGWYDDLAKQRTLLTPLHPGFGKTPRLEWVSSIRDLAAFYAAFVRSQALGPVDVVGISLGGWIAAEMIAADPGLVGRAVLVAPPGIRPPEGEIFDLFRVTAKKFVQTSALEPAKTPEFATLFGGDQSPEQFELWEDARAEVARLAWQPYLFDPTLPHRLALVDPPPALLVWGREDPIVPVSACDAYARALRGAERLVLDGCGHRPEIEKREAFVGAVGRFLG